MTIHRLYVCTTCVRDRPLGPEESSRGARLAAAVESELELRSPAGEFDFLRVPCLNGCLSPCNVAYRASGKYNLRFSRLGADDAAAVVDMLAAYLDHPLGDPVAERWPAALEGRRTVHTPPPSLLLGGPR